MFPGYTPEHIRNMTLRNAVDFGKFILGFTGSATLTNFNDVSGSKDRASASFASLIWLVFPFCLSAFLDHIVNVIKVCTKKKMSGITAKPVIASMKNMQVIRNRSICQGPSNTVRTLWRAIDRHCSIAVTTYTGLPNPAVVRALLVDSGPEAAFYRLGARVVTTNVARLMAWSTGLFQSLATATRAKFGRNPFSSAVIMANDISERFTFYVTSPTVCFCGNRRFLSTTTQTKAIGISISAFCSVCPVLMSKDITKWFAPFPSVSFAGVLRNICFLSTTALAVSAWDFLRGLIRGMLAHVGSSFQLLTMPRAVVAAPWLFYWRTTGVIIAQMCQE